jgi:sugar phosphate isomerase/epimerase
MDRRDFLLQTSKAAMMLPFLNVPAFFKEMRMGIIVHSYAHRWNSKVESKKYPPFLNAVDLIEHCHQIGAGGVQVGVGNWSQDFAKKVRDKREKLGLYIEGSIGLPRNAEDSKTFEQEVIHAKEAGAEILRTVCLSGRRYETFHSRKAFGEFRSNSITSLQLAEPIVRKHKMKLAVENHKDWRATELVEILQKLNSEWIGVTLDFGNSISLMEDPMEVVETLAPFIFTTHVKDMGVDEYPDGFLLSEVPLGNGILDLPKIFDICKQNNSRINFNLEMITRDPLEIPCLTDDYWSTFNGVSGIELARTLRMVRQNIYKAGLPEVSHLNDEEKLATEEQNILASLQYSKTGLGLK